MRAKPSKQVRKNLPGLEDTEIRSILDIATTRAFEALKLNVEFAYAGRELTEDLFAKLPTAVGDQIKKSVYDFKGGTGDKGLLTRSTAETLRSTGDDSAAARAYAKSYLISPPKDDSLAAFADALVSTQLHTPNSWRHVMGSDGKAVIDESPVNEYLYWLAFSARAIRHEVVLRMPGVFVRR